MHTWSCVVYIARFDRANRWAHDIQCRINGWRFAPSSFRAVFLNSSFAVTEIMTLYQSSLCVCNETSDSEFDCSGRNLDHVPACVSSTATFMYVLVFAQSRAIAQLIDFAASSDLSNNSISTLVSPADDPYRATFARFHQLDTLYVALCTLSQLMYVSSG